MQAEAETDDPNLCYDKQPGVKSLSERIESYLSDQLSRYPESNTKVLVLWLIHEDLRDLLTYFKRNSEDEFRRKSHF